MLKNKVLRSLVLCSAIVSFSSFAVDGFTCASKQKIIENEIEYAKTHNNLNRMSGLNKALQDVKDYCDNSDLEEDYKDKIEEKVEKVAEREDDLAEAKLKGDRSKIFKRESKLKEAQEELAKAKADLESFYKELKAE